MGGDSLIKYWNNDIAALMDIYKQFQVLIPSKINNGAAHTGEDGRYIENLIKHYIRKYLPSELEVLTGFILRPGVVCGFSDKARKQDDDMYSTQLDIIIYDTAHYPVFQRIEDTAIVPPEGVIAIISVKKTLTKDMVTKELPTLREAANLCRQTDNCYKLIKKPVTALVSIKTDMDAEDISPVLAEYNKSDMNISYDELVACILAIDNWNVYKKCKKDEAEYRYFLCNHENKGRGFQYLLEKILNTYYTRNGIKQPGFTALRNKDGDSKIIAVSYNKDTK